MRWIKIIALFVLLTLLSGCGNKLSTEDAIEYVNTKYEDEFAYYTLISNYDNEGFLIFAKCEKYPECNISIWGFIEDGKPVFYDNYLGFVFEEKVKSEISRFIEDTCGNEFIIDYHPDKPSALGEDIVTYEDYLESSKCNFAFQAAIPYIWSDKEKEQMISKMNMYFEEANHNLVGIIYFMNNEALYDEVANSEESFSEIQRDNYCEMLSFSCIDKTPIYNWR